MILANRFFADLRRLAIWAVLALVLNSVWELAQLPLYRLWHDPDRYQIAAYVIHCILGDAFIAAVLFLLAALAMRNIAWPVVHPWRGGVLVIGLGLAYTMWSEWYHVYQVNAWSYAPDMPLIRGIGLTPLLQWIVVPGLMILAVRRWR